MVGVAQLVELWIVAPAVEGSNPFAHPRHGPLAQLAEQLTLNQRVLGSNPRRPTIQSTGPTRQSMGVDHYGPGIRPEEGSGQDQGLPGSLHRPHWSTPPALARPQPPHRTGPSNAVDRGEGEPRLPFTPSSAGVRSLGSNRDRAEPGAADSLHPWSRTMWLHPGTAGRYTLPGRSPGRRGRSRLTCR